MMQNMQVFQTIEGLREFMMEGGYGKGTINQFNSTTNQLLKFMNSEGTHEFNTDLSMRFLKVTYGFEPGTQPSRSNAMRLGHLQKLSEYQLHGAAIPKTRGRKYIVPEAFREATENFLAHRRFIGIVERNMSTISLYLERFFSYLTAQDVKVIPQIGIRHTDGFLRFITGFSNQSKDHMMRTVRQFMEYCFHNGYHTENLSKYIPTVHYEKRSNIPSAYSREDVTKLLSLVDRGNPVGKRNYAILLLITRLGLRAGDVSNLQFENIDWEQNKISLTQHKTGRPLTLPLLEDVGNAIIDYLKFGRPKCDCKNVFVRHKPTVTSFTNGSGIYTMVANYIGRAGLLTKGKKRGPHALRHSLASRLLEENVPLPIISEILGHANTNTTAVYLSIGIDKLRGCALEV